MILEFTETAWEDFNYWIENDVAIAKKIKILITSIMRSPSKGLGKPEPLKHEFKGCWSRRITREHRIVYKIAGTKGKDQKCIIIQCRYHYDK